MLARRLPTIDHRYGLAVLAAALLLGTGLRLALALTDDGIFWPDEVFQSLEPAHRLVFGYGLLPWEFQDGARSWTLPGLVAGLISLSARLGLDHPRQYLTVVKAAFALLGGATTWATYLLSRGQGASRISAAVGASLFGLCALGLYFAPRAMSESAATFPLTLGLALVLAPDPAEGRSASRLRSLLRWLAGGSLLGLSVLLRLHCALFCIGALALLLGRRRFRAAAAVAAALVVWALAYGLLDRLTWGHLPQARWSGWFHSALTYLEFNAVKGGSASWGTSAWHFYAEHLLRSMPAVTAALLAFCLLAARRAWGLLAVVAAFLALHSFVGHKELRFLLPALPVLCALAGVGLEALPQDLSRWVAAPATLLAALVSASSLPALTFGDLGQYPERPTDSALDDMGPLNRMLLEAHDRPDLCGVAVDLPILHLAWTGGLSRLHRKVPLYHRYPLEASAAPRPFNYVVTADPARVNGEVVARDRRRPGVVLARLGGECAADPAYPWRLH